DQPGEAALRVAHPAGEVEGAHEVVHARGTGRGGAEEDGWVAEHLPQPEVAEAGGDVPVEGAQEERGEPVGLAQDVTGGEVAPRGEARVEEPAQGDVVGAARGGEVG